MPSNPSNERFRQEVVSSFEKQAIMKTIGAQLARVEAGEVEIRLPFRADLTQQDGYLHAGIIAAIADSACGYAAHSLMPAGTSVLSVEFKINLCSPAAGDSFIARGSVEKAGRTLYITRGEVYADQAGVLKLVALMQGTMIARQARGSEN